MHPLEVFLIFVTAGAASAVYGHPAAPGTPAARFWEKALPGTPMPEAIADLVQEGIDDSPLGKHYDYSAHDTDISLTERTPAIIKTGYHHVSSSLAKVVLPPGSFFQEAQMRVGSTMTVSFAPASVPPILPRDVAEKVPFRNLADVLTTFNIPPGSAKAAMAADTLSQCTSTASPPVTAGEQRACATSLEATVGGATRMLAGSAHHNQGAAVYWAASSALPRAGLPLQPYVVQAVTPLAGDRHVGCHTLPYPYAVYYCHMTGKPTRAYAVTLLRGAAPVTMAAICHVDTSDWDPAHPAFKMLHTRPGGAPVCHFMSYASLLFGEKAANA